MKILSVDTSSAICSISILENEKVIDELNIDNGKTHSETLMPSIMEILQNNNLKISEIDLLSCVIGPGSFTGIRIGVACVKAISEVNNIPIASVTSLETLARIDNSEKNKIVLIDARNNQVYCGVFDKNYNKLEDYMADDILIILEKIKKYNNSIFIGDGSVLHKDIILEKFKYAQFAEFNKQLSKNAGKIAYQKYLKNELKTADTILPIYLRKSQAERMKKRND